MILERYYPDHTYIKYCMRRKQKEAGLQNILFIEAALGTSSIIENASMKDLSKSMFVCLVEIEYFNGGIDKLMNLRQRWSEKGDSSGIDDDPWFALDEPSGLIYAYSGFVWKDFEETYYASLTPKEKKHQELYPDSVPYEVDFFREGKLPYYYTMHKENFFELFSLWDACAQKEYDYIVWYEDETGWVRLQGFDSLDQAQEFITNK